MVSKQLEKEVRAQMEKAVEAMKRELAELRTGRANPKMVEGLRIDYYGTQTLLKDLAAISVPEARLIVIHPWDPTCIPNVEKAIMQSQLGITPANDGKLIRLSVPQLSEERRKEMVKVVKKIGEEGRISLRTVRREFNERVKVFEKDKKITEDEKFKLEAEIQKMVDTFSKDIEKHLADKEKELEAF